MVIFKPHYIIIIVPSQQSTALPLLLSWTLVKVLYLITKSNFGGAQRYVHDLATAMKERGHDVAVGLGGSGPLKERLDAAGVRTVTLPSLKRDVSLKNDIRAFREIYGLLRSERPDILHLNSSKVGALGALAGRLSNIAESFRGLFRKGKRQMRIVFTGHGWAFNEERGDIERALIGAIHWLTIMLAHRVIAVSQRTRDQILALPVPWNKIIIVYNGIGEPKTLSKHAARDTIFAGTPWDGVTIKKDALVIGTLAELHRNKGLAYAIEGMAMLKKMTDRPVVLVIVGEGEERDTLQKLVDSMNLRDCVLLAGYRPNAASLLSAFDAFLLSSITEAFPYAILEAGKAGLPIIASSVGGIPEIIDDMESGILIHSKNPLEIARAIMFLVEEPERRKRLAQAIDARIARKFSLKQMIDGTLRVYDTPKQPAD